MKKYDWQTIGHQKIVSYLQKSISNNKLSHAYLLSGKEFLGKKKLAREFVATIICNDFQKEDNNDSISLPCHGCKYCQQLKKNIHPDVIYLSKNEEKKNISVEQIREIQKSLSMASFLNSYKFAIIERADDLNESAQNALLKLLEEPTKKTILILICNDYNLLLPTVVSRCQLIKFYNLAENDIFDHLVGLGANREDAKVFTALSHGQVGVGINFLNKKEDYSDYLDKVTRFINIIETKSLVERFKLIDEYFKGFKNNIEVTENLVKELDNWQIIIRDILNIKNNVTNHLTNIKLKDDIEKFARIHATSDLMNFIKKIQIIKQKLNYNINPRLAIENLVLDL